MRISTAQLPRPDHSQDRVFVIPNAVIMLDGASSFIPAELDPGTYADQLGTEITRSLMSAPVADLVDVLARAIAAVAQRHNLRPGESPSSTVAVLRGRPGHIDLLVLGDSPIHYGTDRHANVLTDTRLAPLPTPERQQYRERLRAGHGYDDDHRALLGRLQSRQREYRNTRGGYWIAEAKPEAAQHALVTTVPTPAITWAVLATDGIANSIEYHGDVWYDIARHSAAELDRLLVNYQAWEASADPNGKEMPRAKTPR